MNKSVVNILVGRKKIEWVAHNHKISAHAKMQMVRRGAQEVNLKLSILNSPLAWKLQSGYIAIALNLYEYVVVGQNEEEKEEATIVTYLNLNGENYTVIDKMLVEYQDMIRYKGAE